MPKSSSRQRRSSIVPTRRTLSAAAAAASSAAASANIAAAPSGPRKVSSHSLLCVWGWFWSGIRWSNFWGRVSKEWCFFSRVSAREPLWVGGVNKLKRATFAASLYPTLLNPKCYPPHGIDEAYSNEQLVGMRREKRRLEFLRHWKSLCCLLVATTRPTALKPKLERSRGCKNVKRLYFLRHHADTISLQLESIRTQESKPN